MVHMGGKKFEMRKFEFIYDVLDFTLVSAAVLWKFVELSYWRKQDDVEDLANL